jgi:hypothetical protein
MKKAVLSALLLIASFAWSFGQVVLEDFEDGARLPWNASFGDGVFEVVDNPPFGDTLGINGSAKAGAYTKEAGRAFSLLIAVLDEPLDLSLNNQFRIQVKAPVRTSFILKLEGTGEAIEERKKIGVANQWIEYTFNFSRAKEMSTLDKIILFFDPGVDESEDTYLFDNLIAEPSGECDGVERDPSVLDDFECQRNIVYGEPGYLDIEAVDNPDPSGINTSARVGRYTDRQGAFHALVIPFFDDLPLQDRNIVKIKVWAPVTGRLLVKFERGASAPVEKDVQVTDIETWVEYAIDFSDQAGARHQALVFFFNAGVADAEGDIYYIDDIRLEAPPEREPLEDFEGGPKLVWESLQNNPALNGTFNGAIPNPDPSGVNTSPTVGSYTKGTSALGGLQALLPVGFSLTGDPQINLQVWAPPGATSFSIQLFSPLEGLKLVTRPIEETQQWVNLSFNFEEFEDIDDFERIELYFDRQLASSDTWYFDNLIQGAATIDPCEGVVPIPNIIDDFDCQRNVPIIAGADRLQVVRNPDPSGINPNASDLVGQYSDPLDEWSALVWDFGEAIDLSILNQLNAKIWSPKAVPLLFKLEGGTSAPVEIFANVTQTGTWVQYAIDFSDAAGGNFTRLAIFFNAGQLPTEEDIYFIDDVEWRRAPYTECVADFETELTSLPEWTYFANADLSDQRVNVVVDNPDPSGINTSARVGQFIERPGGAIFAGMFTDLDAPIALPNDNKTIRMKVWMNKAARVVMKLERGRQTPNNTGDVFAEYTTPGEWEEVVWNFSDIVPDDALWDRLTIIMNFDETPEEEQIYFFDDIVIGDAFCATTSLRQRPSAERLRVFPNPAHTRLTVEQAEGIEQFVLFNLLGQPVRVVRATGQAYFDIDLLGLNPGVYLLNAYDRQGALRANARIVKQ